MVLTSVKALGNPNDPQVEPCLVCQIIYGNVPPLKKQPKYRFDLHVEILPLSSVHIEFTQPH